MGSEGGTWSQLGFGDLFPPCQRELIPRSVEAPSQLALGGAGLWGRLEVAALNRPEQGKARYQGWPCWHRAEKGWGIYWSFIRGEKEQPASSHLRRVGETVQATQPSYPSRLVLGSLKTQLGQEEMGNSATVES